MLRLSVLVFLVALAVQARLIRPGDRTPTWPLVLSLVVAGTFALLADRREQPPAPRA